MVNKVLSIEIDMNNIKICVVSNKKKIPRVYQTYVITTPDDCIEDGFIKNPKLLAEAIKVKLRNENIKINRVIFTISSSKIASREVFVPAVKENKLSELIQISAADYFPFDITEYCISYMFLEKLTVKEDKRYRLLVLAAHNNLVSSYYEVASALSMEVEAIDYLGNSIYQMIQKQGIEDISMFVHINEQNTIINIMHKNVMILHRGIPYGASSVGAGQNTEEDVKERLDYLVHHITRVLDYYTSKNQEQKVKTIYLSGVGAMINGIDKVFTEEIGLEVRLIELVKNIAFFQAKTVTGRIQSDLLACLGASISPVNLVPKAYVEKSNKKDMIQSAVILSSLAIIAAVVLAVVSTRTLDDAKREKEELTETVNQLKALDEQDVSFDNLKKVYDDIIAMDQSCNSGNQDLVKLLNELDQKLPSSTKVHSFRVTESELMMDLSTDSKDSAAMTLMQLKKISMLSAVNTNSIIEETDELGNKTVKFSVIASLSAPVTTIKGAE